MYWLVQKLEALGMHKRAAQMMVADAQSHDRMDQLKQYIREKTAMQDAMELI